MMKNRGYVEGSGNVYADLGVAAAVISLVFTDSLLVLRRRFQRMKMRCEWSGENAVDW